MTDANFEEIVEVTKDRLGKDQSYLLESSAIREIHKWSDQITLEAGLRDTIEWVDANIATLNKLPWTYQHKT